MQRHQGVRNGKMNVGVSSSQRRQGTAAEAVEQVVGQGRDRPTGQLERQRKALGATWNKEQLLRYGTSQREQQRCAGCPLDVPGTN